MASGGDTQVILCMLLLQNFMTVIKLSCLALSDISDFPTLDQIYLRNVARCVSQMFFVDSVFIIMGYRDKVILHYIALKS